MVVINGLAMTAGSNPIFLASSGSEQPTIFCDNYRYKQGGTDYACYKQRYFLAHNKLVNQVYFGKCRDCQYRAAHQRYAQLL